MNHYIGRHVDLSPESLERSRARDLHNSMTWPCKRYQGRHSAFVAKVRAA
jgi:hypothetical protein